MCLEAGTCYEFWSTQGKAFANGPASVLSWRTMKRFFQKGYRSGGLLPVLRCGVLLFSLTLILQAQAQEEDVPGAIQNPDDGRSRSGQSF